MGSVAIIGAGAMGEAIIAGMVKAGHKPSDIAIIEKRPERADEFAMKIENAESADDLIAFLRSQ